MARTKNMKRPEVSQGKPQVPPTHPQGLGQAQAPAQALPAPPPQAGPTLLPRVAREWWSQSETASLAAQMRGVPEGFLPFGKKASKSLEALLGRKADSIRKKSAVLSRLK